MPVATPVSPTSTLRCRRRCALKPRSAGQLHYKGFPTFVKQKSTVVESRSD